MDKDKKIKHQRPGTAKGVANSQQREKEQNQRSRWTSNSKFNRILGNLERSILGQFNNNNNDNVNNNNVNNNENGMSSTKKTIAKRKHIVHQQAKDDGSASLSSATVGANRTLCSSNGNKTLERSRQSTNGNRVSSTLKTSATAKATNEGQGKLTPEKCQQQQQTHQQHQHFTMNSNQILATNKLPIPPPHANDEARNMNRSLLFGGGIPLTHAGAQSSDVARANLNVDPASTVIKGPCSDKPDQPHDDVLCANRVNSSPASSAKSLPAIGPKPRSHLTKQSNNDSALSTNKEDEESGFSTYQSRRSFLLNHQLQQQRQQQQQQQASRINQNVEPNKDKMILVRANQSTHPPSASNQLWNSMMINTSGNFNNHHSMQQDRQTQYTQPIVISSNQVPIQPVDPRYRNFYPSISQHNTTQNIMPSQHIPIQPANQSIRSNMTTHCDSSQLQQIHRYSERQGTMDNEQHIYANAPPKPRRYQYYDMAPNPNASMINQMGIPANPMLTQPASNSINSRLINNQQISYNQQHTAPPQITYQPNVVGHPQVTSNFSRFSVPNSYLTNDDSKIIHQKNVAMNYFHQQPKQHQLYPDTALTRPVGYPMVKSKSSLDAGDLVRFRQVRQSDDQSNSNTLQAINNRQPIYGSEMENSVSAAYRHHQAIDPNPFRNISQVSQLQRSRSVTHLLPEIEQSTLKTSQAAYQDQVPIINGKFTSYSSASTNQMNLVGSSQVPQLSMLDRNPNCQDGRLIMHPFNQPNNIDQQNDLNHQQRQRQAINNWTEYQRQTAIMTHQQQLNKSKSMAAPNNSFSNRVIRNSMGNYHVSQDTDGFTKPSLDDQIKHLLIGKNDCIDTAAKNLEHPINKKCDNRATYQISNINNRFDSTQSCSNTMKSTQTFPVWANGNEKIVHVASRQHPLYQQTQTIEQPNFALSQNDQSSSQVIKRDVGLFDSAKLQTSVPNDISRSNFSLVEIGEKIEMGNHQQRQYNVQQISNEQSVGNMARRRLSDANSQLIVDLTTPRVLARTQTTLTAVDNSTDPDQCWSINQVGLPQFNSITATSSTNHKKPSQVTESTVHDNKSSDHVVNNVGHKLSPARSIDGKEEPVSNTERNAPYYYSDLKSEAQRQALMNIVQQKSLSPPPQLLSRSADQSNTRLGLKSATMHSSHARTLSENLAQRQRALNEAASVKDNANTPRPTKNRSAIKESNSTTNIAKNIDKLFERPIPGQTAKMSTNAAAQSMLALNDCMAMKDSSRLSLSQASSQHQTESISSGYCSSELKSKNLSKSKSLDNINQGPKIEESSKSLTNPVYENIRCSNRLLTALSDATNCFATKTKSSNMKSLATTNSDESMDSILGSSLEDSDSGSDIIDEIKIPSTDNHLNDISDIIAQLKINHCKLTEEHRATLVRISKTINSRNKQDGGDKKSNDEKIERRLRLLELKSKKCESRSKNQLALIQMMEKVLKQSKLRASGNHRPASQQILSNGTDVSRLDAIHVDPTSDNQMIKTQSNLSAPSDSSLNNSASKTKDRVNSSAAAVAAHAQDGLTSDYSKEIKNGLSNAAEKFNSPNKKNSPDKQERSPRLSQELIKAIVTEKQAEPILLKSSRASIPSETIQSENQSSKQEKIGCCEDGTVKDNAVTKKISDFERRSNLKLENTKIEQGKNPFANSGDDDVGNIEDVTSKDAARTEIASPAKFGDMRRVNNLMKDEDDFIEFLSDDISGHRSQFEASQFSASDFNTSSSISESSTNGTVNNSINTSMSGHDVSSRRISGRSNGYRQDLTSPDSSSENVVGNASAAVSILKNKCYNGYNTDENNRPSGELTRANESGLNKKCEKLSDDRGDLKKKNNITGLEKFKNVLGNVIDVDICPMNNLSQCSPVNNQA